MPSKRRKMACSVDAIGDGKSVGVERLKKMRSGGDDGGRGESSSMSGVIRVEGAAEAGKHGKGAMTSGDGQEEEDLRVGAGQAKIAGFEELVEEEDDDEDEFYEGEEYDDDEIDLDEEDEESEEEGESEDDEDEDDDGEGIMGRILMSPSGRLVLTNDGALDLGHPSDDESVEGSRSRSEEDLGAIGGATRIEDTGASPWKDAVLIDWEAPVPESSQERAVPLDSERVRSIAEKDREAGVSQGRDVGNTPHELNLMDADISSVDTAEGDRKIEEATSVSKSEEGDSESEGGSVGKDDKGSPRSTAYGRAFSKIFKSKAAAESDIGPVLSARQPLVAKKLAEDASDNKDKKESKRENKELREKAHHYPKTYTDTKEKDLIKLATKGVVKLFNAVSTAQKVQAGGEGRDPKLVAKQSKSAFLSKVRSTGSTSTAGWSSRGLPSPSTPTLNFGTVESQEPTSRWSVVREDFMLGKQKLKDWDKEEMGGIEGNQILGNQLMNNIDSDLDDSDDD